MNRLATHSSDAIRKFGRLLADEQAATAIEYALIAGGVAAVIAATVFNLGASVKTTLYDKITNAFP